MNRNTAMSITVVLAVAIIVVIIWSLAMRSDTAQDEYPLNSPSPIQTTPQEDISVDGSIDNDINTLQQELQGV